MLRCGGGRQNNCEHKKTKLVVLFAHVCRWVGTSPTTNYCMSKIAKRWGRTCNDRGLGNDACGDGQYGGVLAVTHRTETQKQ